MFIPQTGSLKVSVMIATSLMVMGDAGGEFGGGASGHRGHRSDCLRAETPWHHDIHQIERGETALHDDVGAGLDASTTRVSSGEPGNTIGKHRRQGVAPFTPGPHHRPVIGMAAQRPRCRPSRPGQGW